MQHLVWNEINFSMSSFACMFCLIAVCVLCKCGTHDGFKICWDVVYPLDDGWGQSLSHLTCGLFFLSCLKGLKPLAFQHEKVHWFFWLRQSFSPPLNEHLGNRDVVLPFRMRAPYLEIFWPVIASARLLAEVFPAWAGRLAHSLLPAQSAHNLMWNFEWVRTWLVAS